MWKPKRDQNVNPRQLACFIVSWILVSWANLDKYVIRISCWTFLATGVLLSRDIFRLSPAPLFIASTPCAFLYSSDATELPLVPQEQVQQLLHPRRHNNHYISALNQCAYSTDACSSFLKLKSSFKARHTIIWNALNPILLPQSVWTSTRTGQGTLVHWH